MAKGAETIVIHPEREKDRWGENIGDEPDPIEVTECIVYPQSSRETDDSSIKVLESLGVYIPPGKPTPSDRDTVEARGETWDIDGSVGDFVSKRGRDKGSLFTLKRVGT